jgi:hypothetical protein
VGTALSLPFHKDQHIDAMPTLSDGADSVGIAPANPKSTGKHCPRNAHPTN